MTNPTATQLVVAMSTTTHRYFSGMIVRSTWKRHMQHLRARAVELGLQDDVNEIVASHAFFNPSDLQKEQR